MKTSEVKKKLKEVEGKVERDIRDVQIPMLKRLRSALRVLGQADAVLRKMDHG